MYVPPFRSILQALGTDEAALASSENITIPVEFFKLLLSAIALSENVDEARYLAEYPDVAQVTTEPGPQALLHFARSGYFEGRRTFAENFDAAFYLGTNPDVARAIARGEETSAEDHYFTWGRNELRAPKKSAQREIEVWRRFLEKSS
jgi:hypothetical protein